MGAAVQRGIQPMPSILLDYYFTLLEVLVIVFLIGAVGIAVYWRMGRRWQNRLKTLQQRHAHDLRALEQKHGDDLETLEREHADELKVLEEKHAADLKALDEKHADDLAKHDSKHFQALYNNLQRVVAHGFGDGLIFIEKKSAETLEGLGEEQNVLREKQNRIFATAHELIQHADNTLYAFASDWDKLQKELLNVRQLVESALIKIFPYAQSNGVTLMPNLDDVEPTVLYRDLTLLVVKNVIGNAIKYSFQGGVVEVDLSLENGDEGAGEMIHVEVKDTGKGIKEEHQERIFNLNIRENGLIEPGSGLGLYLARKAARYQGGDVVLVHSSLNQGSVFRIILPYKAV
jgi:signal transduction histidine kinase